MSFSPHTPAPSTSNSISSTSNRSKSPCFTLEDIRLRVILPGKQNPKPINVAPDLLVKDLLSFMSDKLDLDPEKHMIRLLTEGGREVDVPPAYMEKTIRNAQLEELILRRTVEDYSQMEPNSSQSTVTVNEKNFFFSKETAVQYKEFEVVKVNKYSVRQERILGIDGNKIYNMKPKTSKKTKNPERGVDDIVSVRSIEEKPRSFGIVFHDGETLFYEAKTIHQAGYIVAKLKYLLQMRKQQQQEDSMKANANALADRSRKRNSTQVKRLSRRMSMHLFNPIGNLETE